MAEDRALPPPDKLLRILCQRLLKMLREHCPDAFPQGPDKPIQPGRPGPELPLDAAVVAELVQAAAETAGGGGTLLWDTGESQLLVHTAKVETRMAAGLILVRIPVECDETGGAVVQVAFAVGRRDRPAGLLAATESRPSGPPEIVDVWGEALIAFAWQAVTRMAEGVAFESGRDVDGAGLLPLGIVAGREGLLLSTTARHEFDRVRP